MPTIHEKHIAALRKAATELSSLIAIGNPDDGYTVSVPIKMLIAITTTIVGFLSAIDGNRQSPAQQSPAGPAKPNATPLKLLKGAFKLRQFDLVSAAEARRSAYEALIADLCTLDFQYSDQTLKVECLISSQDDDIEVVLNPGRHRLSVVTKRPGPNDIWAIDQRHVSTTELYEHLGRRIAEVIDDLTNNRRPSTKNQP